MNVTSSDRRGDECGTHGVSEIFGQIFHLIIRSFFYTLFWGIPKEDTLVLFLNWFWHGFGFGWDGTGHRFWCWVLDTWNSLKFVFKTCWLNGLFFGTHHWLVFW